MVGKYLLTGYSTLITTCWILLCDYCLLVVSLLFTDYCNVVADLWLQFAYWLLHVGDCTVVTGWWWVIVGYWLLVTNCFLIYGKKKNPKFPASRRCGEFIAIFFQKFFLSQFCTRYPGLSATDYCILIIGRCLLQGDYCLLVIVFWFLHADCHLLVSAFWWLHTGYCFVIGYWSLKLVTVCCFLHTDTWLLPAYCMVVTAHSLLQTG